MNGLTLRPSNLTRGDSSFHSRNVIGHRGRLSPVKIDIGLPVHDQKTTEDMVTRIIVLLLPHPGVVKMMYCPGGHEWMPDMGHHEIRWRKHSASTPTHSL